MAVPTDRARVAIVTGAAGGIGHATSLRLLSDGWSGVAVDRTPMTDDPAFNRDDVYQIVCDLTDPATPRDIVAKTMARFGSVDLLVNNAGIAGAKPVDETDDANLARIMDINFTVPFRLSREVLKVMKAGASIVQVSSVVNFRATPSTSVYTASKSALAGLTRQMAREEYVATPWRLDWSKPR
jgi:NAD(P)-dependent dehydrogenase (short-subunit alcohol dehydrogenase family)